MGSRAKNYSLLYFSTFALFSIFLISFLPLFLVLHRIEWSLFNQETTVSISILINAIAFYFSAFTLRRFERFPQRNTLAFILPISLSIFAFFLTILLVLRLAYSIKMIAIGFCITLFLLSIQYVIMSRARHLRLCVVPLGEALSFSDTGHYIFVRLVKPEHLPEIDGVVADMHSDVLTPVWERFLSNCALQDIPVYNAMQLKEALTGKVNVKHLVANNFGDLSPSLFHQNFKRIIDVAFLLLISPIVIPVMVIVAVWISLDSPGGPFYVQPRMGLGGKWFNVIKFRSMYVNHDGKNFTEEGEDYRITRVGKIIRKYRLDELPQFWNVLRGDMSLIGPRPESAELAKWYDEEVPFFAYRHVVRPGISGWAQVMHGYAAGVDDMKDKLAYDFYYIKHFSLWLDLLIWYKTIRTVLTGFGSR